MPPSKVIDKRWGGWRRPNGQASLWMRKLSAPLAVGLMAVLLGMFSLGCGGSDAIKFGGGVTGTGGNGGGGVPDGGAGGVPGTGGSITAGGGSPGGAGRVGGVGGEASGGAVASGGHPGNTGGGPVTSTGGVIGLGGRPGTAGAPGGTGGAPGAGGVVGAGGGAGRGTAGRSGTGGTGGGSSTGGAVGTGGTMSTGGASGSGGTGGAAGQSGTTCGTKLPTTCADLDTAYDSELKAQLMCGGLLGKMECVKLVSSTIGCTCVKGFVVDDGCLIALQKRYADLGCPSTCTRTPTCMTATSAKCTPQGLGLQSMCVSM